MECFTKRDLALQTSLVDSPLPKFGSICCQNQVQLFFEMRFNLFSKSGSIFYQKQVQFDAKIRFNFLPKQGLFFFKIKFSLLSNSG
jgi:hypothetical protein